MNATDIKQKIEAHIEGSLALVTGDDGAHFDAIVVSDIFTGKTLVKRQQLVYAALTDWISSGQLHALALRTLTLEQWDAEQRKSEWTN